MGSTVNYAFPYPDPGSTVDVPRDVQALAVAVDALIRAKQPRMVVRETDVLIAATQADPVLRLPVDASKRYILEGVAVTFGASAYDMALSWDAPAGCVVNWGLHTMHVASTVSDGALYQAWRKSTAGLYMGSGAGGNASINSTMTTFKGFLINASTAGFLTAFWSPLGGASVWAVAGSWMRLTEY